MAPVGLTDHSTYNVHELGDRSSYNEERYDRNSVTLRRFGSHPGWTTKTVTPHLARVPG